jgi:hypothetical protein
MTWLKRLLARIPDHYDHVHVVGGKQPGVSPVPPPRVQDHPPAPPPPARHHEVHIHVDGRIWTEEEFKQAVMREINRLRHGAPD